jgi:hypothetical protein
MAEPIKMSFKVQDSCLIPHFIPIVQHLAGFGNNDRIIVRKEYEITNFSFSNGKWKLWKSL